MTSVNMNNGLGKFNNKGFREDKINELETRYGINSLEQSPIWDSTGIDMDWILPGYATADAIGKFIGGNRKTITWHTEQNKEFDKYLVDNHYKLHFLNKRELEEHFDGSSTSIKIDHIVVRGHGLTLYTMEGIMHIIMTNTRMPLAAKFREAIIQETKMSTLKSKVVEEITDTQVQAIINQITEDRILPAPDQFHSAINAIELSCLSIPAINKAIKQCKELRETLTKINIDTQFKNFLIITQYSNELTALKDKLEELRANYYEEMVMDLNDDSQSNMTDLAKVYYRKIIKRKNLNDTYIRINLTNKLFNMLIDKGVLEKREYTVKSRIKDNDGKFIWDDENKCYKTEIKTNYKYIPTSKFDWISAPKYGTLGGKTADVIRLSKMGEKLIKYIILTKEDDLLDLDDNKFMEILYLDINKKDE